MKLGSLNCAPSFTVRRQNGQIEATGDGSVFLGYTAQDQDGVWTKWRWDGANFELSTDRFGIYPTYYFKDAHSLSVSTSVIDLLKSGASPELDDAAIAVFLRLGFFLGEDTPFRHIRALPPGCTMRESALTWRIASSAIPSGVDGHPPTRAAALQEFGVRFQAAVDELASSARPSRLCLPLSGGRDSRHILFALAQGGHLPACCATLKHFPPKPDEDARIAAEVAAAVGVSHFVIEPSRQPIKAELRKNELTSFCSDEHGWTLELSKFVRAGGYNLIYDGIAGDVLSAGLFLTAQNLDLYRRGKLAELAEMMLGGEKYLASMLHPDSHYRWRRELAKERLVTELARYASSPNPIGQFYFFNRTRREIALMFFSILGRDAQVLAPFLAASVFDLLASLPAEYFLDHSFHTEAISLRYPKYAHLPYEAKDAVATRQRWLDLANWTTQVARYCVLGAKGSYVRSGFTFPRLLKGLIDANYGAQQLNLWTIPLYLEQLARLQHRFSDAK